MRAKKPCKRGAENQRTLRTLVARMSVSTDTHLYREFVKLGMLLAWNCFQRTANDNGKLETF